MTREMGRLKEESKRLREESAKGGKEVQSAFASAAGSLGSMAAGFVSVNALVGAATRTYSDWRAEVENLAKSHDTLKLSIVRALAEAGKLELTPQAEKFVRSI